MRSLYSQKAISNMPAAHSYVARYYVVEATHGIDLGHSFIHVGEYIVPFDLSKPDFRKERMFCPEVIWTEKQVESMADLLNEWECKVMRVSMVLFDYIRDYECPSITQRDPWNPRQEPKKIRPPFQHFPRRNHA